MIYTYRKDACGNVIAILDDTGAVLVKYVYDAWGNHSVVDSLGTVITDTTHIGHINPFRYHSYYYDTETNYYYLKSRYYDPEIGRFISPDSIEYIDPETINGLNLYAYCGNNPVMRTDSYGTSWSSFWNKVGNFFSDAWDWFVDDVVNPIGKFVSNSWNWFVEDALPVVTDFVATLGGPLVSNLVNIVYYNYFADVNSTLTSSSYGTGYLTRWQRLDFVKTTTKQAKFNYNVWRYYGEYSAHMYGWFAFKSFYQGDNPTNWFGEMAKSLRDANISYGKADERWYVNLFAIICGMLGI